MSAWLRSGAAAGLVFVAGSPVERSLLFEPFVAAAQRAGHDLASAGGGPLSHDALHFVLGFVIGTLVWLARPRLGRRLSGALLMGALLWLLAYPALVLQHELFGVLSTDTARRVLGFGMLQMGFAAMAATFASRDANAPVAPGENSQ